MIDWRLYVIIDPRFIADGHDAESVCQAALRGGAGVVQLRDKESAGRQLVSRAGVMRELCEEAGAIFIVNDRLDVALASGAHGVHLGPNDVPVSVARQLAPQLLIGGSAGTVGDAKRLVAAGADYLGSGAVFDAMPSKPDATHRRGLDALAAVVAAVDVPVVGIGGIDATNAHAVAATGAAGVAVIRAVGASSDPESSARELAEAFERGRAT